MNISKLQMRQISTRYRLIYEAHGYWPAKVWLTRYVRGLQDGQAAI